MEQTLIKRIVKKWKSNTKKSFLYGLIFLFVIVVAVLDFMIYSNFKIFVSKDDIIVSNLSELDNGKIFFTLEVDNSLYAKDYKWQEKNQAIYITIHSVRYNLFQKKNEKYDFAKNTIAKNNWLFQVNNTGIKKIYYSDSDTPNENNSMLIWENGMEINKADNRVNTYVQTYSCFGNSESGSMAEQLYKAKNPYIGDMTANGKLASVLKIQDSLGSYKNELQTKEEPYGWTFEFEEAVEQENEEKLNSIMKKNAYVLLALIDNLNEVTWTYQLGNESKALSVTAAQATKEIGQDIKSFSDSSIGVQELLLKIGIE